MAQQAVSHMCIRKNGSSAETKHLPREPCSLMRSQVFMPSCWDGENIDSPDHISHVSHCSDKILSRHRMMPTVSNMDIAIDGLSRNWTL